MFANIILYFLSYYIFILQNFIWFKHININTLLDVKTYKYCIKLIYAHKWHSTLIAYISKQQNIDKYNIFTIKYFLY